MMNLRWILKLWVILPLLDHFPGVLTIQAISLDPLSPGCHPADRASLLSFKAKITEDTTGILSSWVGSDCCRGGWEGVECDSETGRVTGLVLQRPSLDRNNGLYMKGTLSASLSSLKFLEVLVISGMKHIRGSIPESISNSTRLTQIVLEDNSISGTIPSSLGLLNSLKTLLLDGNRLTGPIPPRLGNLKGLLQLSLGRNNLAGPIPATFRCFQGLQFLDLSHNQLSGLIPDFIGQFRNLTFIDLSYNQLTGSIPSSLCSLSSLTDLSLSNNQLTGRIPDEISGIRSLTSLSLANNHLTGPIPRSLAQLQYLWYLNVSRNQLSSPLPGTLDNGIPSILSIDLSYNSLSLGTVPEWIRSRELSVVHLAGCKLAGALPIFTKPSSLISLDLSDNQFTHGLVDLFTRMPNLQVLKLSNNRLKHNVSRFKLPQLLSSVDLSSNQLFGSISTILGNHTSSFLEEINVSKNMITGMLPEFGEGLNLKVLKIGSNNIAGHIPSSISNLAELQTLDISRNRFIGTIPPSLGKLVKMEWLDLSANSFTGNISDSLLGLTILQHANFRANRLCGGIPQGRPFNVFPIAAYAHNKCLCGKPMPPCRRIGQSQSEPAVC
ncbi:hypothetical protein Dimus_010083 [Dionaea muscipula]